MTCGQILAPPTVVQNNGPSGQEVLFRRIEFKNTNGAGKVAHSCNPSTEESKVEGLRVQG